MFVVCRQFCVNKLIKLLLLVLETMTIVFRPPTDRQILDINSAESSTAWVVFFLAKNRKDNLVDKHRNDVTILDLQLTNIFHSICGQDPQLRLKSLLSPKNLSETPLGSKSKNCNSRKERPTMSERTNTQSVVQGVVESDDKFLARLKEVACYCDCQSLKTVANPQEEMINIIFISVLRSPEEKLKFEDGIKTKSTMALSEKTENLQYRSQAMTYAIR